MDGRRLLGAGSTNALALFLGAFSLGILEMRFSIGILPDLWSEDVLLYLVVGALASLIAFHIAGRDEARFRLRPVSVVITLLISAIGFHLLFGHLFDLDDHLCHDVYVLAFAVVLISLAGTLVTWLGPKAADE